MSALRSAEIRFKDRFAGSLVETASGGTRFRYSSEQREDIACCFPVVRREHEWALGLHPFFQHLGPEGWLREKQAHSALVDEADDLGVLMRYGADCIGAVSLHAPSETADASPISESVTNPGRTISGIQKKLLVVKVGDTDEYRPAPAQGLAPYVAKFNSEDFSTIVRNEALSLRWTAAVLGPTEVTEFRIAPIPDLDETALVVTRFDRGPAGEKFRQEDFAQVLGKPKGRENSGKYDASYEDVARVIKNHSARPMIDLARFLRRLIAYALIGNCDAHLKNFSLLEQSSGLRLSPAYDIVNTAIYPELDRNLALSITGEKVCIDEAHGELFREFGRTIGLPERVITQIFSDLKRTTRKAASVLRPPPAEEPSGFMTRFEEGVKNACARILEA